MTLVAEDDPVDGKKQAEAQGKHAEAKGEKAGKKTAKPRTKEEKAKQFEEEYKRKSGNFGEWIQQHISMVALVGLLLFSLPLYLLFRRSPAIPDLRLSECFVAMVYITNMIAIYDIVPALLCFSAKTEIIYDMLSPLLTVIPIKQLSGYSYPTTIWRLLAALIPFVILCLLLAFAAIVIIVYSID